MSDLSNMRPSTKRVSKTRLAVFLISSLASAGFANTSHAEDKYPLSQNAFNKPLPGQQAVPTASEAKNLATLEAIDFTAYNNKNWDTLRKSYDKNLVVTYTDGHSTKGVDAYLADLKTRFTFAPNVRVTGHPIKFASGDWTALMAVSEGTFSQPLQNSAGAPIKPTNKPFKINIVTISHWKDGVIDQQYVFFDNAAVSQQIGVAPAAIGQDYGPKDTKSLFPPVGQAHLDYVIQKRLFALDEMDFDVFGLPHLTRLPETHSKDILVMWPDGHVTHGLEPHTQDIKELFAFAPNLIIRQHPVRFGTGEWTALVGVMEGTFTGKMRNPAGGAPIPPTGKQFKVTMTTLSHWKDGVMDAEYLIYDNAAFMKQLGLTQ
ncbi:ester cyclase [Serratia sp. 22264]|uniref:ester cyclase n=1 Tax=Serratia sp. 22264 TaxID=3453897 RepID=UPI003F86340B